MAEAWQVDSWQRYHAEHQPQYRDQAQLKQVLRHISQHNALLSYTEVMRLRQELHSVYAGQTFILHGGDCAERFHDCTPARIDLRLHILQQMSALITSRGNTPVLTIARMAGQYAKPRSDMFETVAGQQMLTFLGENINALTPDPQQREPDPQRLEQGHQHSATTLQHMHNKRSPICVSHEALLLAYEQAMTVAHTKHWYNHGAHLLWVGMRTAHSQQAHVEYLRGINNAIGIKVGPEANPQEIVNIIRILNPDNACDRIVIITRFGHEQVQAQLPRFITAVRDASLQVIWTVDPMHGNTVRTAQGIKTRPYQHILTEIQYSFAVHRAEGSRLSGVHLELSGEDVTECLGGPANLQAQDLPRAYHTACDPRLNREQSLAIAEHVGKLLVAAR